MSNQGFFKAVKYFGSQQALAKAIGVSPQAVNHWANREHRLPYVQALKIFILTEGSVSLNELVPEQKELNALFGRSFYLGIPVNSAHSSNT
jgi:DNA-binding transcriptional regulator YdaS (Cro superfamily)